MTLVFWCVADFTLRLHLSYFSTVLFSLQYAFARTPILSFSYSIFVNCSVNVAESQLKKTERKFRISVSLFILEF